MNNIFIVLLIIIIIYIFINTCNYSNPIIKLSTKPYLWQYWDNIDDKPTPVYITLSLKTVDKYCSDNFEIVRLNKNNISDYIPEIKEYKSQLDKLIIAHKVDIYRLFLLKKYGGIYMDCDIICLKNPIEIIEKLQKYDYVGFGCTELKCSNGYGNPSNWIMASKPNGILITYTLNEALNKLQIYDIQKQKFKYHDIGKHLLWDQIDILNKKEKYLYYHYHSKFDGSRDKYGNWIDSNIIFSNTKIEYEDERNMIFFVYYNSGIKKELKEISEKDLLEKDWNYTKFLKQSLNII